MVRRPEDKNRSFGCPTIRTDIPYKEFKSVADYQNYGDEPEAVDLLFPSTFQEMGITEQDFQMYRSREEIRALFAKIGFNYKIGQFNAIYNKSKQTIDGSVASQDRSNVRAFLWAMQ